MLIQIGIGSMPFAYSLVQVGVDGLGDADASIVLLCDCVCELVEVSVHLCRGV